MFSSVFTAYFLAYVYPLQQLVERQFEPVGYWGTEADRKYGRPFPEQPR
ncbi:hypothetical protein WJ0W_005720 [Paenibacillus melissococcoides]|uniref:Uncharacterized protein n=1 Tax=Paenibacillus melissococcoides TaxID=2912268 RepID=A0ABM9GBF9_9BACL|nr:MULTISPECIES: hypothetical protein [Paenibacillus]CAH8243634.1 hypothetical protein WJ0W_000874 [Paenibacillus melissococcoides]CAH8248538.1 hypothetical protein WJ0W_005720 [Paenibacillus melissococcoides]CAH8705043.1 hypothetical protein HTL2_000775 [Paenibacillus melissococcoides]CAH8707817.1 hypothetical protein WDD9_001738 [Paenibacillus melissococcoides]CAH8714449.1 hypothetical protein WDD9_003893 [Paenibacillus melissococcoides]